MAFCVLVVRGFGRIFLLLYLFSEGKRGFRNTPYIILINALTTLTNASNINSTRHTSGSRAGRNHRTNASNKEPSRLQQRIRSCKESIPGKCRQDPGPPRLKPHKLNPITSDR